MTYEKWALQFTWQKAVMHNEVQQPFVEKVVAYCATNELKLFLKLYSYFFTSTMQQDICLKFNLIKSFGMNF